MREGYLEAIAAWSPLSGPVARAEAGARLTPRAGVFGFGEWSPSSGPTAGVGARVTWGW